MPERIPPGRAAAILGINRKTLSRLAKEGKIPGAVEIDERLWRFDEIELRAWIRRRGAACAEVTTSTNATGSGTRASRFADATSDAAYEQLLSRKPRSA
jgi:predicted DNA-binding transcriptional regulator AlpA